MAQLYTERLSISNEVTTAPSSAQLRADYKSYVREFNEPEFPFENYVEVRTYLYLRAKNDSRFGDYNLFLREGNQWIGWCNLGPCYCEPKIAALITPAPKATNQYSSFEVEIGWAIYQSFRGRGYATEAAAAIIDHAFSNYHIPRVVAFTDPDNTASLRVMQKLGMRTIVYDGEQEVITIGVLENKGS